MSGDTPSASLDAALLAVVRRTKGFLPEDEADALHHAALAVDTDGPLLEVGAYCGRSAVYLGDAARRLGTVLYSLDHHRGSEENQSGWEWHDPEVVDPATGRMDTLPFFRRTIESAGLEEHVVALVGRSAPIARWWSTPLAFCFVDGGHAADIAHTDYEGWSPKVAPGGLLAIHDVFPDPADGGRPPYEIYLRAIADGFLPRDELGLGSLRVLSAPSR